MFRMFRSAALATTLVLGLVGGAQAATVTYQSAEADPKVQLTISDSIAGRFRFTLSTVFGVADFLGLGFDFAGTSLAQGDLSVVSYTPVDPDPLALTLFGDNTNSQVACGNGCNFNGAGSSPDPYDYIIRIGSNGGGQSNVSSVVFDVITSGSLASNPFSSFGVRAQSTSGPSESIKFGLVPVTPVPLPAGLPLMLAGMGALAVLRRRKAA